MPDASELTVAAERLRQHRPSQGERYSVASMLDEIAAGMAPKPKAKAKPKSIEQAVQQLDDDPVEEIEV